MQNITINEKEFTGYISEAELKKIIDKCVSEIASDLYDRRELVVIGVLNGAVPFMNEIVFSLGKDVQIDYVKAVSYGDNTCSSGKIELMLDTKIDLKGKTVLIVDDIADTGNTMSFLKDHILSKGASGVLTACLFCKKNRLIPAPDYYGAETGDEFIIGFGLDYAQKGRNLKYILKTSE